MIIGFLIDPSFWGVNSLFKNEKDTTTQPTYNEPNEKGTNYNVVINRLKLFWLTSKQWWKCQGDYWATDYQLVYPYFKED